MSLEGRCKRTDTLIAPIRDGLDNAMCAESRGGTGYVPLLGSARSTQI
jgi:hypothetical protein